MLHNGLTSIDKQRAAKGARRTAAAAEDAVLSTKHAAPHLDGAAEFHSTQPKRRPTVADDQCRHVAAIAPDEHADGASTLCEVAARLSRATVPKRTCDGELPRSKARVEKHCRWQLVRARK